MPQERPQDKTVIYWNKIFTHNPDDGHLYKHPDSKWPSIKRNTPLGRFSNNGYVHVNVNKKTLLAHRIIYEMYHGPIPSGMMIDHIDGNKLNNKIENLRLATRQQNLWNMKPRSNNTLPKGVTRSGNKYKVRVYANKTPFYGGTFPTIEEASAAAIALREQHHGEFARHH